MTNPEPEAMSDARVGREECTWCNREQPTVTTDPDGTRWHLYHGKWYRCPNATDLTPDPGRSAVTPLVVGFTGTQLGGNVLQEQALERLLSSVSVLQFHHGDCVGADSQADGIAESLGLARHVHPPDNTSKRAFCKGDIQYAEKPYLDRNKDIVNACDLLIAMPFERDEQRRSGTWSTVRYARRLKKPVKLIMPNGEVIDD